MKYVASKHTTVQHIALFAALVVSSAANAATYDYTGNYAYMRKPAMTSAQRPSSFRWIRKPPTTPPARSTACPPQGIAVACSRMAGNSDR
ncbi:hypothetical protein SAMN05444169_7733 [Bradyrhizobium erythrophlei]|uniref:Uncharacterized protein n=1 Tax=Bradyrhizobium erythrophlei TaxID=1437360 RepID=A0A1M5TEJ8_9BRAD|nr:hypothetical protein SAMN05444169_7733 [Bradyrhizobium erythrophlei]